MSTNVLQQSAQWLIDKVRQLDASATKQGADLRAARTRINALKASAERIADATKRTTARANVGKIDSRQKQIEALWRAFDTRYKSVRATAISWMKASGVLKAAGLGDLGALPLVPFALAAGVLMVWGAVAAISAQNAPQLKAIALQEQAQRALLEGKLTPEQFTAITDASVRATDAAKPKGDPLGLASFTDALLPIGLVVIGIMVLPTVLQEFKSRRKAVTA